MSQLAEDDIRDEISRLEARIEELADSIERCRKIILISKLAIGAGAAALLLFMLGLLGSNATALVGAIVAIVGGVVGLGSNTTTLEQFAAASKVAEAQRAELIGMIDLQLVPDGDRPRLLH